MVFGLVRVAVAAMAVLLLWGHQVEAQQPQGALRIVVDPGHGGKDRGVSVAHGVLEKDVVLTLARELREEARAMGGFQMLLSREEDETFAWPRRLDAARGADLWLSLHANADFQGKARGPRVFYSAPRANGGVLKAPHFSSKSGADVRAILQDMALTKRTNENLLLAEHLQRVLEAVWGVSSRPSRQVPLLGLPELECPSVLVEVGFLTNAVDLRWLQDQGKRRAIVRSLLRGLRAFFQDPRRME